jgi:hypothetical protein
MCCVCGGGSSGGDEVEPEVEPSCYDTDAGTGGDSNGDGCDKYYSYSQWCSRNLDTASFNSTIMCCACGGGGSYLFTDDVGILHFYNYGTIPTVACSVQTAIFLFQQFNVTKESIAWVYGTVPTNLTAEENNFLNSTNTFLSSCPSNTLDCNEKPNFWIVTDKDDLIAKQQMRSIQSFVKESPIFLSSKFEQGPNCMEPVPVNDTSTNSYDFGKGTCVTRSLIDVLRRFNELAVFLNINQNSNIACEQMLMCNAAKELAIAAEDAQKRGIRVMAINVPIHKNNVDELRPINPLFDTHLRTYEELGVPLLHTNGESIPTKDWDSAMYPVEVWLLEKDRADSMESKNLVNLLPKGDVVIDAWNDIEIISYKKVADILKRMTQILRDSVQLYEKTPCTPANVTSEQFLNFKTGGLQPAQYACYDKANHQLDYLQCSTSDLAPFGVTCATSGLEAWINTIHKAIDSASGDSEMVWDNSNYYSISIISVNYCNKKMGNLPTEIGLLTNLKSLYICK